MTRARLRSVPTQPVLDDQAASRALDWLHAADDAFLACRGNHNFPKIRLVAGGLPSGVDAKPQHDGGYQITVTCPDCGTTDTYTTVPGGWLGGGPRRHHYDWPEGYRMPKGASQYVTSYDCQAEVWRRTTETLEAPAKRRSSRKRK